MITNSEEIINYRELDRFVDDSADELKLLEEAVEDAKTEFDATSDDVDDYDGSESDMEDAVEDARSTLETAQHELKEWHSDNPDFEALRAFRDGCSTYTARRNTSILHEDYFTEHIQAWCTDVGYISREMPDYIVIDWDATAENFKSDYAEVDFDGVAYYIENN